MSHKGEFYNYPGKAVKVYLPLLRLPSPSETRPRPRKGGSGGSIPSRRGNSKAGADKAATANGNGLQRLYIFPFWGIYNPLRLNQNG